MFRHWSQAVLKKKKWVPIAIRYKFPGDPSRAAGDGAPTHPQMGAALLAMGLPRQVLRMCRWLQAVSMQDRMAKAWRPT